jgi:hypothetical protein
MANHTTEDVRTAEARVPSTFMEYVRALGPGILVAMAWLSAGDLVSASVSGSTYGYALMWALVLALFARYFFVSAIGKYVLCNNQGDTSILAGFGRLWRGLPALIGVIAFILGFTYQTYIIKGAATALGHLHFSRIAGGRDHTYAHERQPVQDVGDGSTRFRGDPHANVLNSRSDPWIRPRCAPTRLGL